MDRARRAGWAALFVVMVVTTTLGWGHGDARAAEVAWPPSTLVVSEFQTGGASASDEFVEVANQGSTAVDLMGLEVVYATSSGSTVTRKGTWSVSTGLAPGQRVLLANSVGVHAAIADLTYSGGFAATGGALALRIVGGSVIDAVGWGDATNAFVEGTVAPAPPAGSSLERRPGGTAGNAIDTNDNLADWFVQGAPSPQNLAAPIVPDDPGPSPTPSPTSTPLPSPSATATPNPTPTPSATPSPTPTPAPTALPTPPPTPAPTATPSPTPAPTASPSPSPTPAPTATPARIAIADARALADGSTALIEGVLTTDLGALESGHGGFVQDATGGIAIYLDDAIVETDPAGTTVRISGTIGSRFAQRTIRAPESAVVAVGTADLPAPLDVETGAAGESHEGRRITLAGTVTASPDQLADGLGVTLDDGSGPVRAVIGPTALGGRTIATGMTATVTGPLGQRDSSGTGMSGYRVYATLAGELELVTPTPTPTPTSNPSPSATPSVSPTPAPSATPTASPNPTETPAPTPAPSAVGIAIVRTLPIGTRVTTTGIVVAEAGRVGSPSLVAIHDGTAGLIVHGATDAQSLPRGTRIEVTGKLSAPYGQLEIKPSETDVRVLGTATPPLPATLGPDALDEGNEAQLVTATGVLEVKPTKSSSGDITLTLARDGGSPVKVMADATSRVTTTTFQVGATYRITGVVGQRASRTGALDGYRIWIRDAADVAVIATPQAPNPTGSPAAASSAAAHTTITIAAALRTSDRDVRIEGVVTIPATLLDATGRRVVVQDGSAAVELLLPTGTTAPPVGTSVRATGRIGVAYGAPRLRADAIEVLGRSTPPPAIVLHTVPGLAQEWRLVTITGRVASVHKLGDRWRAEITVGGKPAVVVGQPGSGIASSALVEGRQASVTGIVRRPFPNATDRRFAVTPRFPADMRLLGSGGATAREDTGGPAATTSTDGDPGASVAPLEATDVDVIDLGTNIGRTVRIGGLVVELRNDGFTLDDGTAVGRVELRGAARDELDLIEPEDALNVVGRVESAPDGPIVVVDDAGRLILAGDPIAAEAAAAAAGAIEAPPPSGRPDAIAQAGPAGRLAALGGGPLGLDGGMAGLGTLVMISALSVVVTLLRRRQLRRRLAARIAARLATLAGPRPANVTAPAGAPAGPSPAERGPSTIRSA